MQTPVSHTHGDLKSVDTDTILTSGVKLRSAEHSKYLEYDFLWTSKSSGPTHSSQVPKVNEYQCKLEGQEGVLLQNFQ